MRDRGLGKKGVVGLNAHTYLGGVRTGPARCDGNTYLHLRKQDAGRGMLERRGFGVF